MARPPRLQVADGIYHLTARGNERRLIYRDDVDRRHFLVLVADLHERYSWRVLSYCLLGNHYHLLVRTPKPNLAHGMRQLNGVYAQSFNRRHRRVGHLLQGRYSARLVQANEHLLAVVRYIVRNPLRAGLCREPGGWRWSSHRAVLGEAPPWFLDVEGLLSYYAPTREVAREHYRAQVEEADREELTQHPLVAGDHAFIASALEGLASAPGIPRRYLRGPRPGLSELLARADSNALARAHEHGYGVREIARHIGVNASTVSRRLKRQRTQAGAATDRT